MRRALVPLMSLLLVSCVRPPGQPSPAASPAPSATASVPPPARPADPFTGGSPMPVPSTSPPIVFKDPADCRSTGVITGRITDEGGTGISDVRIQGRSLSDQRFANGSDTLTVASQLGSYALNGVPRGTPIEVRFSHPDYSPQTTVVAMPPKGMTTASLPMCDDGGIVRLDITLRRKAVPIPSPSP